MSDRKRARLKLVGASCASCIVPIREVLERREGVMSVDASYVADLVLVDFDPGKLSEDEIVRLIKTKGYTVLPVHQYY